MIGHVLAMNEQIMNLVLDKIVDEANEESFITIKTI